MNRYNWDAEYARLFVKSGAVEYADAVALADAATDEFENGLSPEEAVDSELSYWSEG